MHRGFGDEMSLKAERQMKGAGMSAEEKCCEFGWIEELCGEGTLSHHTGSSLVLR